MFILNIAAGKMLSKPEDFKHINEPVCIVNLDLSYLNGLDAKNTEAQVESWKPYPYGESKSIVCKADIFDFLSQTIIKFDHIIMNRFLEHIIFTDINYFIYLLSTVCKKDCEVSVIVPNYEHLANMILNENQYLKTNDFSKTPFDDFEAWNIVLTTEVVNEPTAPHASLWTPSRVVKFWELEKLFKITSMNNTYSYDGRDIYIHFIAKRI